MKLSLRPSLRVRIIANLHFILYLFALLTISNFGIVDIVKVILAFLIIVIRVLITFLPVIML